MGICTGRTELPRSANRLSTEAHGGPRGTTGTYLCAFSAASERGVSLRVRRASSLLGAWNAPCWSSDSSTLKVPISKFTSFHRNASNSPRRSLEVLYSAQL